MQVKAEALEKEAADDEAATGAAQAQLEALAAERSGGEERAAKRRRLGELDGEASTLKAEVELHKHNDPEVLKVLRDRVATAKEAADRWTDNLWSLKDHLVKRMGEDKKKIDQLLETGGEFDYVD